MPLSTKADVLSPLYRNCLFRSDERVDAHDHVSRELADHLLRWKSGMPDVAMFKGSLNRLSMYLLRYGAEVEVTPNPFDDFTLVHTSLSGGAEIEVDGQKLVIAEGRTGVLTPKQRVRLRWYPGTQQLILKVPHVLLRELAHLDEADKPELTPGYLLDRRLCSQWDLIMHSLLNAMSMPAESALDKTWLDHFEHNAALFLLSHQVRGSAQASALGLQVVQPGQLKDAVLGAGDSRRMNMLLEYMDARLGAPLSLEDMASAAGVSIRTINELCHRQHGVTPMELLRNLRLDAVRSRLRAQPDLSITETALTFGFGHLGRFSAYYFDRFGELPRQTQARPE
ncbi:AraC family transcriptional regulator [Variovorax sp. J22P271]|uniref:AraC family transcriptional regulator n=1 Tax=Variovorax davisae TaxID=3053515 RepID=UPI002576F31E|nr:AraC family transcriptional regulator [Variovorax sp. J22P271]MDM0036878.1 AraC family transcriptional regulator [Variovorax sp. J22P271]